MSNRAPKNNESGSLTFRRGLAAGAIASITFLGFNLANADGGTPCDPVTDNGCVPTESTTPLTKVSTTVPETTTTVPETTTTVPETTTTVPDAPPATPTTTPIDRQVPPIYVP